jgi:hypothetical protein
MLTVHQLSAWLDSFHIRPCIVHRMDGKCFVVEPDVGMQATFTKHTKHTKLHQ